MVRPRRDVPQWVDQLYYAELLIGQLDDNGRFQHGYINSVFGQKDVRRTTYGYNYMAINDDVYLYTGMSSVTADESISALFLSTAERRRPSSTRFQARRRPLPWLLPRDRCST
mgnify:CR=1 FL=1